MWPRPRRPSIVCCGVPTSTATASPSKKKRGAIDGLLHIHTAIKHIEPDLYLPHRLVPAIHSAEAQFASPVLHACANWPRSSGIECTNRAQLGTSSISVTLVSLPASRSRPKAANSLAAPLRKPYACGRVGARILCTQRRRHTTVCATGGNRQGYRRARECAKDQP
jgi:hypothetical protein